MDAWSKTINYVRRPRRTLQFEDFPNTVFDSL